MSKIRIILIGDPIPSDATLKMLDEKFGVDGYVIVEEAEIKPIEIEPITLVRVPELEYIFIPPEIKERPYVHNTTPLSRCRYVRNLRPKGTHSNRKFYR